MANSRSQSRITNDFAPVGAYTDKFIIGPSSFLYYVERVHRLTLAAVTP